MATFSDEEFGERSVSVVLDGEESELVFIDHTSGEMSVSRKKLVACLKHVGLEFAIINKQIMASKGPLLRHGPSEEVLSSINLPQQLITKCDDL